MDEPEVVVACAWYNRAEYIHETLKSLLAQDFEKFEIVLVNDGSTDPRVRDILDSYDNPRLRIIHQENRGFVRSISKAIESSTAPYIAIQGSGDISFPTRIRKQYEVLKNRHEVVAVASRIENDLGEGRVHIAGTPFDGDASEYGIRKVIMMHGEVMYRRSTFDNVGGYRDFFRFSQDRDLWLRMSQVGKIVVLPDILYRRAANIGGVSGHAGKQVTQRCLSHFAVYCHVERLAGRLDPLDEYGPQAALFWRVPFALQTDIIRLGLSYFYFGRNDWEKIFMVGSQLRFGLLSTLTARMIGRMPVLSRKLLQWAFYAKNRDCLGRTRGGGQKRGSP